MTLLGWIASVSLTVSMVLIVWAALALLNLHPPSRGLVTWSGKPLNGKEDKVKRVPLGRITVRVECVTCKSRKDIGPDDVEPGTVPFCDKCYGPMAARWFRWVRRPSESLPHS